MAIRRVSRPGIAFAFRPFFLQGPSGLQEPGPSQRMISRADFRERLVIIGNGMAGARFAEDVLAADRGRFDITVFGDEPYGNYNRILLSNVLNGTQDAKEIFLNPLAWYEENGITLHAGDFAVPYDYLVFATGSKPFIPPIPGTPLHGVFAFRTLDDCRNIAEY